MSIVVELGLVFVGVEIFLAVALSFVFNNYYLIIN
jgi:hypothetical protein